MFPGDKCLGYFWYGGEAVGATAFERFLHDGPMPFAICRATPYYDNLSCKCCAEQDEGCRISFVVRCLSVPCQGASGSHRSLGPPLWEFEGATRLGATALRGSEREICLWEGLWEDLWEGWFQSFSELFRGFQRFSEVFQRPSQRPSQSAIFLSELGVVLPLTVLPLKTPATPPPTPLRHPSKVSQDVSAILLDNSLRAQRLKEYSTSPSGIDICSSETENLKRATHQGPIFVGAFPWRRQ